MSVEQLEHPYPDGFRHNWTRREIIEFFDLPLMDLLFQAHSLHRQYFDPNKIQLSQLCSIKTGGCPEDCKYCPQSSRYPTDVEAERLMALEKVLAGARKAKSAGATRYCMGAAWRSPKGRDMAAVCDMIRGVRNLGLESCMTLGMLDPAQAAQLKQAGLDYYNHNVDSSPEYYPEIITTRSYEDRLKTLENVRTAGINVCSGGIVGMGESKADRAGMLQTLANLPQHPGSVPINMLVQVEGTPLYGAGGIDPFDFIRTIAAARLVMPASYVRLSAGREAMSDEMQALCFFAGANSIFYGEKLLTTPNPLQNNDLDLFARLGITPEGK
ncbi:MAG: biotin synthase BioB [Alphaproteobacteria bacterium]|nr:biotin synthase BioB [Alphaproteobacteria bacterium]